MNAVHAAGGRVIAVGTTVVRALETVVDDRGVVHPGSGWTELVVTPERGVRAVDGLLTGWHEPEATHLLMLEAIAGRPALETGLRRGATQVATCGTSSATATCCCRDRAMSDHDARPAAARGPPRPCSTRCAAAGQATADDIARQLDMTASGARQHLTALVDDGLAEATELPRPAGQRGRPQLEYTVTDRADALFPKAYGELTNELLGYVAGRRRGTRRHALRSAAATSASATRPNASRRSARSKAKVAELTRILDDDGYLATCEEIARRLPHRRAQLRDLGRRAALRAGVHERDRLHPHRAPRRDVERVQHMVAGAPHCAYEVRPSR